MKRRNINTEDLMPFDAAMFLTDDGLIEEYLRQTFEEDDTQDIINAINTVARAKGMNEIASAAGVSRESLYKSLQANAKPRFETISKVCRALGVQLTVKPLAAEKDEAA